MKLINPELREKRQRAGQLGGISCVMRYGNEHMRDIARKGGRPRALTLAELRRQQTALRQRENKRRTCSPGGTPMSLRKLWELIEAEIKESGELVCAGDAGSPERG